MNWKDHLKIGLTIEIIFIIVMYFWQNWFQNWNLNFGIQFLILIFVSPLVLDLDHRHGKLREGMTFVGLMLGSIGVIGFFLSINLIYLIVIGMIIAISGYLIYYATKHRGFTHTIPFCVLYGFIIYLLVTNVQLALLAGVGTYTHLIADKEPFKIFP